MSLHLSDAQPFLPELRKIGAKIALGNSASQRKVELYSSFVDSGRTNPAGGNGIEHGRARRRISAKWDKARNYNTSALKFSVQVELRPQGVLGRSYHPFAIADLEPRLPEIGALVPGTFD